LSQWQSLQAVQLDLLKINDHVAKLFDIFLGHRKNANTIFKNFAQVTSALNVNIMIPRICARATHRDNQPSCSAAEYLCRSIYIPFTDSLISSLQSRFSQNTQQYFLFTLHPLQLENLDREEINVIQATYHIDN
jgi:hypothetical protein